MKLDVEWLTDEQIYHRLMREDIPGARRSVLIVTALVKQTTVQLSSGEYAPFLQLVDDLIGKGVQFFLLLAGKPSRPFMRSLSQYPRVKARMQIKLCVRNHIKAILIDGQKLYIGSANLTGAGPGRKSARKRNFEIGMLTRNAKLIEKISNMIKEIWEGQHCPKCEVQSFCRTEKDRYQKELTGPVE